jgi:hypothetical protein
MELSKNVDKKVTITGKISKVPWQHMMTSVQGHPASDYFDVDGGAQIVIYSKSAISYKGKMSITGKVLGVQGSSKRPGASKSETYSEYHLIVDEWKPVE